MTRHVLFGTLLSTALAVGLSAQTGSQPTGQEKQQRPQNQQQVTVTGCLMEGAGMATATSGTGTATGTSGTQAGTQRTGRDQARFHLTNAQITPSDKSATTGTGTGTSGTSGTTGTTSDTKVQLIGGDQQDLKQYVNSRVEIRGMLLTNQSDRSRSGAATGTGTGTAASRPSGAEDVQRVRVTSVRQLAPSCSAQ